MGVRQFGHREETLTSNLNKISFNKTRNTNYKAGVTSENELLVWCMGAIPRQAPAYAGIPHRGLDSMSKFELWFQIEVNSCWLFHLFNSTLRMNFVVAYYSSACINGHKCIMPLNSNAAACIGSGTRPVCRLLLGRGGGGFFSK